MNYRTGDVADEGIRYEKCPHCGRSVPIISSMISRVSEVKDVRFEKVKGTLIDLNQFYSIMPEFDGIDEWQVILSQGESFIDELTLNVSPSRARKNMKEEISEYTRITVIIKGTVTGAMRTTWCRPRFIKNSFHHIWIQAIKFLIFLFPFL